MSDPQQPPYGGQSQPLTPAADVLWASLAHLGGILFFLPSLLIWLLLKDRGRFTDVEAKEALNFQITVAIAWLLVAIAFGVLGSIPFIGWVFGTIGAVPWVWIASVVCSIVAFVQVRKGTHYRYPFAIRFIK